MARKKISDMTAASAYTGSNEFYELVQGGNTRKGSHALLKTYFDTLYAPVSSIMTTPTSVTPTFTGFGSVSGISAYTWRVGAQLFFEITFTSGTATGTEARIGLRYNPGSGEVDVTTVSTYPTLAVVGSGGYNSGSNSWYPLAEASKTYICVGTDGAYNVLAKRNGNQIIGSGQIASLKGSVIINGW